MSFVIRLETWKGEIQRDNPYFKQISCVVFVIYPIFNGILKLSPGKLLTLVHCRCNTCQIYGVHYTFSKTSGGQYNLPHLKFFIFIFMSK